MKMRLAQPGTLVDLSGIAELKGIRKEGEQPRDRRDDAPRRGRGVEGRAGRRFPRSPRSPKASATGRSATWARSAARSRTTTRPRAIRPRCWALGATVNTNKRKIAADDFFKGMYETALADGEIITSVSFPIPKKAAYVKFVQPASRFALVGVFVAQTAGGVRVAVTGAGVVGVPREAARGRAGEDLHRRRGEGGQDERSGPQQRPARIGRVSGAPDLGAGVAGGGVRRAR